MTMIAVTAIGMSCKKENAEKSMSLYSMIGTVSIVSDGGKRRAAVNDLIKKGDTIVTGATSQADIVMGGKGLLRISENSTVLMASVIDAASNDVQMELDNGKVFVTLSKLSKGSFKVKTPTAVASVRGTSFRVVADKKESRLDVLSGKVQLNPVSQNAVVEDVEAVVESNQSATLDAKTTETLIKEKKQIAVRELKKEEVEEIKKEIKDIKPEKIDRLDEGSRRELDSELQETGKIKEDTKTDELEQAKKDDQRRLALKQAEDKKRLEQARLDKERQDKERAEKERIEKERIEKERREKEKRDRATNIPTL